MRNRVLEVIQCWAHGFRDKPQYRIAQDTVNLMKLEGYKFPAMREADALFVAESAPDWLEGECCHRCRSDFSLTNRKHHCRNCGQIFCSKCSGKVSALPHFGIEKEVRVCDSCFDSINAPKQAAGAAAATVALARDGNELPVEYLNSPLSKVIKVDTDSAFVFRRVSSWRCCVHYLTVVGWFCLGATTAGQEDQRGDPGRRGAPVGVGHLPE